MLDKASYALSRKSNYPDAATIMLEFTVAVTAKPCQMLFAPASMALRSHLDHDHHPEP
jgi:hypothetical protein